MSSATLLRLPIDSALPELLAALAAHGAAVLHAPPGAGKTTRVPPALAEWLDSDPARRGQVVVLEPRRVAARAAARRIAEERDWTVGREVGWWIRFERRFRPDSKIVFATEGVLLRWLQRDPFLEGVAALVFDEFHERTLAADLSLALARRVRRELRPDLALVVMSATLDIEPIAAFLSPTGVIRSEGRLHPVDTRLLERPDDRPLEQQVASAIRRAAGEIDGDLLAFLPGMAEIRRAEEALASWATERGIAAVVLHGDLPAEAQDAALRRGERRRFVLATNVAETSITVEGVRAVVDSGLARQLRFDPATGLDRLETIRIARAAADQRAGRAGREAPGLCLRLWSAADDLALRPFESPEVRRVDLASAVLELSAWGEKDAATFDWFEAPEPARLERAVASLHDLGALDAAGITPLGRRLAALPLAPRLGRLVLEGERLGVGEEAALVAAMLSERSGERGADRGSGGRSSDRSAASDLLVRLEALDRRRSRPLFEAQRQIVELVRRSHAPKSGESAGASSSNDAASWAPAEERLLRAIAAAYLDRLCRRRERGTDRAVMVGGRGVRLAKTSAVKEAPLFVAVELDSGRTGERSEAFVRAASVVERDWLPGEMTHTARELSWDDGRARVVARRVVRFDDLELESSEIPIDDPEAAAALLAERAALDLPRALALDRPEVAALLDRLRCLGKARPELALPAVDDRLLRSLLPALCADRRSFHELAKAPVAETLSAALSWQQRAALDAEAPKRLEVPSGSRIRIDYADPERPLLAARIQELFGLSKTPTVAGGRLQVLIHLLAPSGRPQQVTADLASFWKNTYPIVRRELASRYPKHAWPDDPTTAKAERGPKRRPRS